MSQPVSGFQERTMLALRALYTQYGYAQYKMSKFEEYDLYARNKDFLISSGIITFTDTNGRLMALKPDVTLSIVKNTSDIPGAVQKLCYNENVYRVSRGAGEFREIMQAGLECIGDLDEYSLMEVLLLAALSLKEISPQSILDISDLGLIAGLLDRIGVPQEQKGRVIACIGEKNRHELAHICNACGIDRKDIDVLCELVGVSGCAEQTLPAVEKLLQGYADENVLGRFAGVVRALLTTPVASMIHIDFSVVNDVNYYNGLVFKGFVAGLPGSVLSGGQYDSLMQKMGRASGAIGFAVYMDALERLESEPNEFDVDVALIYGSETPVQAVYAKVREIAESGRTVRALRRMPDDLRAANIIDMAGKEASSNG